MQILINMSFLRLVLTEGEFYTETFGHEDVQMLRKTN